MLEALRVLKPGGLYILSDTGMVFFKDLGVIIDNFVYRDFGKTGNCNVSYLKKSIRDLKRNGFEIKKAKKLPHLSIQSWQERSNFITLSELNVKTECKHYNTVALSYLCD